MDSLFIAHARKAGGQQLLASHLTEVGEIAAIHAEKIDAKKAGQLIGLLHDFGKFSEDFQTYIKSATGIMNPDEDEFVDFKGLKGKIDHSTAGSQLVWNTCQKWGAHGQVVGQILSLCIASHHSGLIDCLEPNGDNNFIRRINKQDKKTHLNECSKNAHKWLMDEVARIVNKQLIAGIIDQLRKISTQKSKLPHVPLIQEFNKGLFTRMLFSCLIDADRSNSAYFELTGKPQIAKKETIDWDTPISRLEEFVASIKKRTPIDSIRSSISNYCREKASNDTGIYSLTVPTGGGKTYASLRFGLHHARHNKLDRIIYVIPYTSIIEQNAEAIRKVIERKSDSRPWVLEHHSSLEPEQQTWHSKLVCENWDSPIVLTTMVQFLEVLFSGGTRGVRRMHQLANSLLIFDEIQTLPVNCTHMFCNAINYLASYCNTTGVMCTATQPVLNNLKNPDKGQLDLPEENELAPNVKQLFDDLGRVDLINQVKPSGWSTDDITSFAIDEFKATASILIIVNTKVLAQKIFEAIYPSLQGNEIFYLSTNLCARHRRGILSRIKRRLKRKQPVFCISTQLIEAGVDIDFSTVIRFLAGLDSVAQAAGRCNRNGLLCDENGNPIKGKVYIINPKDEKIDMLYDIKIGRDNAQRVLGEGFIDMLAPDAMTQYFNYYFYNRADDMGYKIPAKSLGRDDTLLNLLSSNNLNTGSNNSYILKQSFMTAGKLFKAIDSPTQAVIVPYGPKGRRLISDLCGVAKEFDVGRYHKLLKQAQRYSVNVFPNVWKKLLDQNAVHEVQPGEGIYYLDEQFYSPKFGLSQEPCNLMSTYIC